MTQNTFDLILKATEESVMNPVTFLIAAAVSVATYFVKDLLHRTDSEQKTTRGEIREIMVQLGRIEERLEKACNDIDALGAITRELRK